MIVILILKGNLKNGVRKVNVDTDLRIAATGAVRKVLYGEPDKFDVREFMGPAREAMYEVVKGKMIAFGSAGHSRDYAPKALEDMKKEYRNKKR